MSYQDEVLDDDPAVYLRLDKTGSDSDGDTWPDSSTNGLDGIQKYTGVTSRVARGWASPIETDGASRAFEGWTNASIEGPEFGLNGKSWIYVPDDPLIQPAAEGAVEEWLAPLADIPVAGSFLMTGKSGSIGTMLTWDGGSRIGGFCRDTADNLWTVSDPSFLFTDYLGTFFHVAVNKIGNLLQLFINGTLRAQTTITSGLGIKVSSNPFYVQPDALFYLHAQHDEAALYTHALGADRWLAHYEAALLNLPLIGRADMRMIATLDGDQEPTPQLFPFRHNWENEVRETLTWLTDVQPAEVDYEQRAGIRQRPLRSLEFSAFVDGNVRRRRLHAYLFQNQRRTVYLADETEAALLTAAASSGSSSLAFNSIGRGFEDGGLMAVYQDEDNFEILEIDTVGDSSTTLAGVTAADRPVGAVAFPIVRALIADAVNVTRHADELEEAELEFRVKAEDVPLAPRRNGTYTPRYTYRGIEVFDPFVLGTNNWNENGRGEVTIRTVDPESPAGIFSRVPNDTAAREIVSYSLFLDSRTAIARLLAWLWSIQGRRVAVWVPTNQEDFAAVSSSGTSPAKIVVAGHDFTNFYQSHPARQDLALIFHDETMSFKRIASADTAGANDELTIEQAGAVSLTNLRALSFLKLCRLQEDTITLVWHNDELVEVTLNFLDLLTSTD